MGTGCRFPPIDAVDIKTQCTGLDCVVDSGYRTAPKNFTGKEKKERQMETERRRSASDPEWYLKQTVSAPHAHMGTQSERVTPRALVYKMDYPHFQTFPLVYSVIDHSFQLS